MQSNVVCGLSKGWQSALNSTSLFILKQIKLNIFKSNYLTKKQKKNYLVGTPLDNKPL